MNVKIRTRTASGEVKIPSSKSVAHRLLINAALTDGKTVLEDLSLNEDISATIDCLRVLGAKIELPQDGICEVTGASEKPVDEVRRL